MPYRLLLSFIFAAILPLAATAQQNAVRIIVPFTAGGATDNLARSLATQLSRIWNQPVVVENKPGAAGSIGARMVAAAAPDGRTLIVVASGHAINELVNDKLPYRAADDFTAISQLVDVPNVLLVPKNSPYRNLRELIAASKEKPGGIPYGTSGMGTSVHLAGELFKSMSKARIEAVFFKGDSESLSNVMGGHVPLSINTVPGAKSQIDAGTVRALAVTSHQRTPTLKDVPTVAESGVPDYEVSTWFGVLGPKGMDPALVQKLNADIRAAMSNPAIAQPLAEKGMVVTLGSPADFDRLIRGEINKWRLVVERLDMRGKF